MMNQFIGKNNSPRLVKKHWVTFTLLGIMTLVVLMSSYGTKETLNISYYAVALLIALIVYTFDDYCQYRKQLRDIRQERSSGFFDPAEQAAIANYPFYGIQNREVVSAMVSLVEKRDKYTGGHSRQVNKLAMEIGQELQLTGEELETLSLAALLHDLGKVCISEDILNKPGKLMETEYKIVQSHSRVGYEVLKNITSFEKIAEYVLYHHERYDGTGYPAGLKGKEIPLMSRIISVADVYDAISSKRVYRPAMGQSEALTVMMDGIGTQFDPQIIAALLAVVARNNGEDIKKVPLLKRGLSAVCSKPAKRAN